MNVDEPDESCLQEPQEWSDQQSEVRFYRNVVCYNLFVFLTEFFFPKHKIKRKKAELKM